MFFFKAFLCFIFASFFSLMFSPLNSQAQSPKKSALRLPPLFGDNMVLQQGKSVFVWGRDNPGEKITVQICEQKQSGGADEKGKWQIKIGPFESGGPFEMIVSGSETIRFKNVMIGEVWVCSGQSNMDMTVNTMWGKVLNAEKEVAEAQYPNIRFFNVEHIVSGSPRDEISCVGGWAPCSPETVASFSATAYFFGRHLHKQLNVPVGLIRSAWGGTPIEPWMPLETLKQIPSTEKPLENIHERLSNLEQKKKTYPEDIVKWRSVLNETDPGMNEKVPWFDPNLSTRDWKEIPVPRIWEKSGEIGAFDGVAWFCREFHMEEAGDYKDAIIHLDKIDDEDITWINGVRIGETNDWYAPRDYKIPPGILKKGKNVIIVRILDTGGNGGIYGEAENIKLEVEQAQKSLVIPLSGTWKYKLSCKLSDLPLRPLPPQFFQLTPTVLYNGMIDPLMPFTIRGAIWYQGESNAARAYQYKELFPAMIRSWRKNWAQGDFPFIFVQLANFGRREQNPGEDPWAELREAQLLTLSEPKCAMAVAIDIGEGEDIHPRNKQDLGYRLGLAARKVAYGEDLVHSGPIYRRGSMKKEGRGLRLLFDHIGGGLMLKGNQAEGFSIAGEDGKFVWAKARIEKDSVFVWNDEISNPVAVRYAWGANPACNLYNKEALPASPFRTDDWQGVTRQSKQ